jgi:hypothetical protein
MQQRQLRLGDILDDYCTRERRLTNHVVVAMVGADVKQTRCTTCDTEHEYKHAKVPRQRRKLDSPAALYAQVAGNAPKRVTGAQGVAPAPTSELVADRLDDEPGADAAAAPDRESRPEPAAEMSPAVPPGAEDRPDREGEAAGEDEDENRGNTAEDEGPVHRPLIRASLPREGQPPITRPIPEFTIRQPGGRPNRFRPRHQGGGRPFQGSGGNGPGGPPRSASPRNNAGGGRPSQGGMPSRLARRHGAGHKRQK